MVGLCSIRNEIADRLHFVPMNRSAAILSAIRAVAAASVVGGAAVICGCETVGQDLSDVTSAFKPTTPREAVRMMVDPHNADNRRQGTVLISNAPWGGTEAYVKQYRDMVEHERDPIVKATAIRALARHGTPDDALKIAPHLTHPNPQVRW